MSLFYSYFLHIWAKEVRCERFHLSELRIKCQWNSFVSIFVNILRFVTLGDASLASVSLWLLLHTYYTVLLYYLFTFLQNMMCKLLLYPERVIASRTHRSWFWTYKNWASASIWTPSSCFWSIGIQLVEFENWCQIWRMTPIECVQIDFENVFKCKSDAQTAEEARFRHHWFAS